MIYGYARISHRSQNIQRQLDNISKEYPEAKIYHEAFTGTKTEGRTELKRLLKAAKLGDTIVFDSVSRMSRNAEEGTELYFELMNKGIKLIFLKESYINTDVYQEQIKVNNNIKTNDLDLNETIIKGIREYLKILATKQIKIAFDQAQKEVDDLRQRTKEGMKVAKSKGNIPGRREGQQIETLKSKAAKEIIIKHYKALGGSLGAEETIKLCGITRNTFFKYVKELKAV